MNKYVGKLFGVIFQHPQTQQVVCIQPQRSPASPEEWRTHWQAKGFPWRTEPDIDVKRQEELTRCRAIVPDIEKGIYPFKGMKLSRADIEWLLATHENGRGPVDWQDEAQRERQGLDMRGANLSHVDLSNLPLACLRSGLIWNEWPSSTKKQHDELTIQMAGANLSGTHLEKSYLIGASLSGANLSRAHLAEAYLLGANLIAADLTDADLERAQLSFAHLEDAQLLRANLKIAHLHDTYLAKARFDYAHLEFADLSMAHCEGTVFIGAKMQNARFIGADLTAADLSKSHLEDAYLNHAVLRDVQLSEAYLAGSYLEGVVMADEMRIGPQLVDVHWDDVNLAVVKWSQMNMVSEEYQAHQREENGEVKDSFTQIEEYETAIRANRQLVVVLQGQGLDEDANRFAYRAQILQRKLYWKRRNFWRYSGSAMLALLAGYGYRMWRILVAYLLIVLLCAGAYFVLGVYYEPHLTLLEAVLTSITAFHGRVFSEPFLQPGEPQLWVTAFEAVAGLVVEGVFIAMLTQKFFGK
jgi:uncharacterized protein YjbI with pentapeptide repeats